MVVQVPGDEVFLRISTTVNKEICRKVPDKIFIDATNTICEDLSWEISDNVPKDNVQHWMCEEMRVGAIGIEEDARRVLTSVEPVAGPGLEGHYAGQTFDYKIMCDKCFVQCESNDVNS